MVDLDLKELPTKLYIYLADQECIDLWRGDGACDGLNNTPQCEYDGGDCCSGGDEECQFCIGDTCICHPTGLHFCQGECKA